MTKTKAMLEQFNVDYKPWVKGDYLRAMAALAERLDEYQEHPTHAYTILHMRQFDPVDRCWHYQLRAIPVERGRE